MARRLRPSGRVGHGRCRRTKTSAGAGQTSRHGKFCAAYELHVCCACYWSCKHVAYMPPVCCKYAACRLICMWRCMLHTCCCMCCMHVARLLSIHRPYVAFMLHACCTYELTQQTCKGAARSQKAQPIPIAHCCKLGCEGDVVFRSMPTANADSPSRSDGTERRA